MSRAMALAVLAACSSPPERSEQHDAPEPDVFVPTCNPSAHATACVASEVVACNADGTIGPTLEVCPDGMACVDGDCVHACTTEGIDLVYVVTQSDDLLSFDPRKLPADPFTPVGHLACRTTGTDLMTPPHGVRPFSMSIDRDGVAWVEYTTGEVFNVSIADASCTATSYVPKAAGMQLFGMGFSSDVAGAHVESLFISGGDNNARGGGNLARVDTHGGHLTPALVGAITVSSDWAAELTGTSEGRLFAFFPRIMTPAIVQELDKATGQVVGNPYTLGQNGLDALTGWAFAQWGGKFYVFVTNHDNSSVRVIDRATGVYSIAMNALPYVIVGAGVSTCAPITQ